MNKFLIAFLLISSSSFAASKWVDEQGRTHYTDQPAPSHARTSSEFKEVKESIVSVATPSVPASNAAKGAIDSKELAKNKQQAADKLALEATQKREKTANCAASQQNLANLKDGIRIATIDPKTGERAYMEDDERAAKTTQYQNDVKKYCN
ncbi:MAG: hypothetical protein RL358_1087 [Pseudomonadota bacterium]|jgi:hypothetical protein